MGRKTETLLIHCRDARSGRPPAGWKIIRMENHPGGKSSGWKIIRVENHPGGKSSGWKIANVDPSGIGPLRLADAQTGRPYSG
jgi:hypothetical protein